MLQSVINRPLSERQVLLKNAVRPCPEEGSPIGSGCVRGRLMLLLPNAPLAGGVPCSRVCQTVDQIQAMLDEAIRLGVGCLKQNQKLD